MRTNMKKRKILIEDSKDNDISIFPFYHIRRSLIFNNEEFNTIADIYFEGDGEYYFTTPFIGDDENLNYLEGKILYGSKIIGFFKVIDYQDGC